jgi:ribonuclease I (enterobacter ribonuclease)
MLKAIAACALFALLCATGVRAEPVHLLPAQYGDFDYYTIALTWQPGVCSVDDGPFIGPGHHERCAAGQPHAPLIGLHGLWPSRPQAVIKANVRLKQWWSRGCGMLHQSDSAPRLSPGLQAKLAAVMPQLQTSMLTHEYDKHVQCFGFTPAQFFATELAMRKAVADTPFGQYLAVNAGNTVAHHDIVASFEKSFGTNDPGLIQLQCVRDEGGRKVLTELWINVRANALNAFPAARSFRHLPIDEDTCPATVLIPAW